MTVFTAAYSNPFPGLRPFEYEQSGLFFGREAQTDELLTRLSTAHFVAVVGSSGCGKSSLVRAGVLPALYGGYLPEAGVGWEIVVSKPGADPIGNLARDLASSALFSASGTDPTEIERRLRVQSRGLTDVFVSAGLPPKTRLLVVIDQFEELFRFRKESRFESKDDDSAFFVKLLLDAVRNPDSSLYVLLTMRSDFLGDCALFYGLVEAVNAGIYLVPKMTRLQREEAIVGPIEVAGAHAAPLLVEKLLNESGGSEDNLPVLQHALMRTWDHWARQQNSSVPVAVEDYEFVRDPSSPIFAVDLHLNAHLEEIYAELDEGGRRIARAMFILLRERDERGREIRRPTDLAEIVAVSAADRARVLEVIDTFRLEKQYADGRTETRSFLILSGEKVDLSHESLIRNWTRYRQWIGDENENRDWYRRLADAANSAARGESGVLRDPALKRALQWRQAFAPTPQWAARYATSPEEFGDSMDFLDRSRRAQLKNIVLGASVIGLLLAVITGASLFLIAERARSRKEREAAAAQREAAAVERAEAADKQVAAEQRAAADLKAVNLEMVKAKDEAVAQRLVAIRMSGMSLARQLDAQSEIIRRESPESLQLSVLLAIESARRAPAEGGRALRDSVPLLPRTLATIRRDKDVTAAALSPDERYVATAGDGMPPALHERSTEKILWQAPSDAAGKVAFSPDGRFLGVAAGADLWLVDTSSMTPSRWRNGDGLVSSVTFSPDSKTFLAETATQIVGYRVADRTEAFRVAGASPAYSNDGHLLAVSLRDGVTIYDVATVPPSEKRLGIPARGDLTFLGPFTPDSRQIMVVGSSGVQVVDLLGAREVWHVDQEESTGGALSGDGKSVIVGGLLGARIVDTVTGSEIRRLSYPGITMSVQRSPDGRHAIVVTASVDSVVQDSNGLELTAYVYETSLWQLAAVINDLHSKELGTLSFGSNTSVLLSIGNSLRVLTGWMRLGRVSSIAARDTNNLPVITGDGGTALAIDNDVVQAVALFTPGQPRRLGEGRHAVSDDGTLLALAGEDGLVLHNLKEQGQVSSWSELDDIECFAFSRDSKFLAVGKSGTTELLVINLATGSKVTLPILDNCSGVAFDTAGRYLAAVGHDTLNVLDTRTQTRVSGAKYDDLHFPDPKVRIGPDAKTVLVVSEETLIVLDLASGKHLRTLELDGDDLTTVFSFDNRYLAVSSLEAELELIDAVQARRIGKVPVKSFGALAFSRNSRYLAAGGVDKTVRIYDLRLRELYRMQGAAVSTSLVFSPDGYGFTSLMFDLDDRRITAEQHVWDPEYLVAEACGRLTRNLSKLEWLEYVHDEPYRKTCTNLP